MTVSDMKKEFVANELTALLKKVDKDFDKAEYIMRDDYMELVIIKDGTGRELYRINVSMDSLCAIVRDVFAQI